MADHLFGLLYLLLAFRLVLVLVRARVDAGFVRFIDGVTDPFYRPFRGIVPTSTFAGWPIAWSIVFALVAYALLHAIVRALLAWVDRA